MNIRYILILTLPLFLVLSFSAHGQQTPTAEQTRIFEELQQEYRNATTEEEILALDARVDALFREIFNVLTIPQNVSEMPSLFQAQPGSLDSSLLAELEELQQLYASAATEEEILALDAHVETLFNTTPIDQDIEDVLGNTTGELQNILNNPLVSFFPANPTTQNIRRPANQVVEGNAFPLDVVWSAETVTPPGYTGKARASSGSNITLTALTPTQNLAEVEFRWIVRDSTPRIRGSLDQRGIGRNTYVLHGHPSLRSFVHQFEVVAVNTRTGQEARTRVSVPLVRPEVRLYAGPHALWAAHVSQRLLVRAGEETTIHAQPFYFINENIERIGFSWEFDRRPVPEANQSNNLTLSISPESALGVTQMIRVFVEHENPIRKSLDQVNTSIQMIIQ